MSTETVVPRPTDLAFGLLQSIAENLESLLVQVEHETVSKALRELLTDTLLQSDELGTALDELQYPGVEHRSKVRIRAMGKAELTAAAGDASLQGRCLDISLGGACLILDRPLEVGSRWHLNVRPLGASSPLCITGSVTWCHPQPNSPTYKVGFQFLGDEE